jgi:endogenous inhibitor of DNA gyrase (YacG/DUF329 family)
MENELKVKCKECGENFIARFDVEESREMIPMAFCPYCQKMVKVISKTFAQYTT